MKKDNTLINLGLLFSAAIIFVLGIFAFYIDTFSNKVITKDTESFAFFGDFIGGTLNPILAFLAFLALLYTIKIQSDELSATREELAKSAKAQQEQSKSLELQNKATELQIFENTFFQLLEQHNQYLDLVVKENIEFEYFYKEKIEFKMIKTRLLNLDEIYSEFKKINQSKRSLKNYFMTLFQILKYIDEYAKINDINAKFYTNIIRALIDDEILRLLAINCNAYPNFTKYKEYIVKYALFEHIYIKESSIETETILKILSLFKPRAFGSNDGLKELIKSTSAKAEDL
ncbi:putative phage abortive infection protein [Halarcobacter sp.]|uniref:putative phage abortive infection protein n=1 Tax=Halarcobacter sp. TaxID=2321133 RepID=UPI003A95A707